MATFGGSQHPVGYGNVADSLDSGILMAGLDPAPHVFSSEENKHGDGGAPRAPPQAFAQILACQCSATTRRVFLQCSAPFGASVRQTPSQILAKMVGATGIEPVTPTMST
jgi:hypothetical protein